MAGGDTAEHGRISGTSDASPDSDWRRWGPYVAGRQWGTVREDYSPDGNAWTYLPFDHAHRRAYRWGEDGIGAVCDRFGFLNLGLALWNGNDDRLKERFFGLTNAQGNHGEDVKEYWWHLDATPTHSYGAMLYRYPQHAFPYQDLLQENARRGRQDEEYELADTGILAQDRFFDVTVRHAKAGPCDLVYEVSATNHGPDAAALDLLPQVWFRNTWSWGRDDRRPTVTVSGDGASLVLEHGYLGRYVLTWEDTGLGLPEVLRCDNETNQQVLYGNASSSAHPKDAIDDAVVHANREHLTPDGEPATKAALHWHAQIEPGATATVRLRLTLDDGRGSTDRTAGAEVLSQRGQEADEFYRSVLPQGVSADDALIARRAFAGLLWGKQLYRYGVHEWLEGDPGQPAPPPERLRKQPLGRNTDWQHLALADVMSMPDEWEYPWFASWDLAFHCVTLAHIDPEFAKDQLKLICRVWAMHPNGQLPAYEWNFSDVNPPVHAWAAWHVFRIDGGQDHDFLTEIYAKLLLNFGWWVNRKDTDDSYLFEGGFLGMDNIGLFDRSDPLPDGHRLEQSDATSWMAFFCLTMLRIAWELAPAQAGWDALATKFLEHFLRISEAMTPVGTAEVELWNEDDGFYYDAVVAPDGSSRQIPVRTMVGLLPLIAVAAVPESAGPDFADRLRWFGRHQPELLDAVVHSNGQTTLSLLDAGRLKRIMARLLDEEEFLSPYGVRSVSAAYRTPFTMSVEGFERTMTYTPAESDSGLFGGNSNWRGPVWMPVNVLLTEALRVRGLGDLAQTIEDRLLALFRLDGDRRPSDPRHVPTGPLWGQAHPTFSEYFHGDLGRGIGASHQTGWSALVAHLICSRRNA